MPKQRGLSIFLCHLSKDKPRVRDLYKRLSKEDGLLPWFDEESLLPGQDWDTEIKRAIRSADVVVVCISRASITKEGYIQKEIKMALDIVDEKPDGTIFLVPLRLDDCEVPEKLAKYHWVDYFGEETDLENGYSKLLASLQKRKISVIKLSPKRPNAPTKKSKLPLIREYQSNKLYETETTKNKYRVLWVDSTARHALRRYISAVYASGEYELDFADDVTSAIRYIMAKEYDAIIFDTRLSPGTDDYWIKIYQDKGEDKADAQLGLKLAEWLLNSRTDFHHKPPRWVSPQRIGVFTVENDPMLYAGLEILNIRVFERKIVGLPATILVSIIERIKAQTTGLNNRE